LREAGVDLVASREWVEERTGVSHFLLDVEFGVGIVGIFQITIRIDDFVSLNGVLDRGGFRFRRTGGRGCIFPLRIGRHEYGSTDEKKESNQQT
jgi:hypothetical protein